jgi:hypothetical protein
MLLIEAFAPAPEPIYLTPRSYDALAAWRYMPIITPPSSRITITGGLT